MAFFIFFLFIYDSLLLDFLFVVAYHTTSLFAFFFLSTSWQLTPATSRIKTFARDLDGLLIMLCK